jgi:hypothetical protein
MTDSTNPTKPEAPHRYRKTTQKSLCQSTLAFTFDATGPAERWNRIGGYGASG